MVYNYVIYSINKFKFKIINNLSHIIISTDGFRLKFINESNKYKKIDMGGKVNNNIQKPIENKINF